jgi:DNA polymerase-1
VTLPSLAAYDRVGLDTETTGFTWNDRPVGLSIKCPDGHRQYISWGHEGGDNTNTLAEVITWARAELARPTLKKIFFNAAYDLKMLAYVGVQLTENVEDVGIIVPLLDEHMKSYKLEDLAWHFLQRHKQGAELDQWCANHFGKAATRSAQAGNYWRAPASVVAPYAEEDADLTLALYDLLRPQIVDQDLEGVYAIETALIPILIRMHLQGVKIDVASAERVKAELKVKAKELQARWNVEIGEGVNVNSTQQLAKIFRAQGLPVWKTDAAKNCEECKRLGKASTCHDSITKELLDTIDHPTAGLVRSTRQVGHYAGTFVDNYLLKNAGEDGRIHGEFHQVRRDKYGTISGRFSSGGALNLQNIPARDEIWAPLIRGLFVPDTADHQWLKADYSQIEYRFFAHYAGGQLVDAYRNDPLQDFHQMVAEMCAIARRPAKNVNFAKLYGAGVKRLAATIGCSVEEAQEFLDTYNQRIPEADALYQQAMRRASARGHVITWGGRKARFKRGPRGFDRTYSALNRLLQGSAADLMKMAMVRVATELVDWDEIRLHLTVHDELDLSVPRGERGLAAARRLKEMMQDFELDAPIIAEVELGENWGATTKIPEQR